MTVYKYTEPDTGFLYSIVVKTPDVATISALALGMQVKLASGHHLSVDANGIVLIISRNGKKSSANLAALKKGLVN